MDTFPELASSASSSSSSWSLLARDEPADVACQGTCNVCKRACSLHNSAPAQTTLWSAPQRLADSLCCEIDGHLKAMVESASMPEWKLKHYELLMTRIGEALRPAYRKMGRKDPLEMQLDGSVMKGTALQDSDVDLLVKTQYDVPRRLKNRLLDAVEKSLRRCGDYRHVGIKRHRKSADLSVTLTDAAAAAGRPASSAPPATAPSGSPGSSYPGAGSGNSSANSSSNSSTNSTSTNSSSSSKPTLPVRLSADLLFEFATVGALVSEVADTLVQCPPAKLAVRAIKLFMKEAYSVPKLKSFCVEALVRHVVEDCGAGGGGGGGAAGGAAAGQPASAAQIFWMALSLFVQPGMTAKELQARVAPHVLFDCGCLFDRGVFIGWRNKVTHLLKQLYRFAQALKDGLLPPGDDPRVVLKKIFRGYGKRAPPPPVKQSAGGNGDEKDDDASEDEDEDDSSSSDGDDEPRPSRASTVHGQQQPQPHVWYEDPLAGIPAPAHAAYRGLSAWKADRLHGPPPVYGGEGCSGGAGRGKEGGGGRSSSSREEKKTREKPRRRLRRPRLPRPPPPPRPPQQQPRLACRTVPRLARHSCRAANCPVRRQQPPAPRLLPAPLPLPVRRRTPPQLEAMETTPASAPTMVITMSTTTMTMMMTMTFVLVLP
ncbi:hypothetical protein Agub_g5790 [Astrephomene gubernaculifera]|uniref:Uncharacterized protein n=1 Tax=Astrephomene gubernaculifera TaxID=47775 RepID=A0AAD3HKX7_9CHLO|nr:hypothetical protein Agub_g5790 [Astrephomene gubernaculifera]